MTRAHDQSERAQQARLEDLFSRVMDLSPADREAILQRECAQDLALHARLHRLLQAHDSAERLLPTPPPEGSASASANSESDPLIGEIVAAFRIKRPVGVGGMGTVYEATQESPKRRVALKVMRTGLVGRDVAQRFRTEAEALGALEHPHIARIYEAGVALTKLGRMPYFAMEFIAGRTLVEHSREKHLDVAARVSLFVSVCDAVEHAHRRGIIHRDLKPGNILVGVDGHAKVLDFGVARLTASDLPASSLRTEAGQLLGTLQYMSPEQASGDPLAIDTRSDVYALGVVLYELLSDVLPYDVSTSTLLQAARLIREHEPRPLGAIVPALKGDLETIVRKAIEKRVEMRYQSAGQLAADLRHYLAHEPIAARPPSAVYYVRKFVRRHRAVSLGAAGIVAALILGVVGTAIGLKRAVDARRLADLNAAESALNAARSAINEYIANMQAASASMRAGDLGTARARLEAADPKFRAWEWDLARSQLDQSVRTLVPPGGHFSTGLALSTDERFLATSDGGSLTIFDARTGERLRGRTHDGLSDSRFGPLTWSPDGRRLAVSLAYDRRVAILDSESLELIAQIDGLADEVASVDWSPDRSLIAVGAGNWRNSSARDRTVTLHDATDGRLVRTLDGLPGRANALTWSGDGSRLMASTPEGVVLFDVTFATRTESPQAATSFSREPGATWSPDGTRALIAHLNELRIVDADTGSIVRRFPIPKSDPTRAAYLASGDAIAATLPAGVAILDAESGQVRRFLRGVEGNVFQFVVSKKSARAWTGASTGEVKEWDLDATGDMLEVQAIDVATPSPDFSIVVHPCPLMGLNGSGPVSVRDGRTGEVLREIHAGDPTEEGSKITISPDGRYVIRTQAGPVLTTYDLREGASWSHRIASDTVAGVSVCTPDGFLLHGYGDTVRCFTLPTLEPTDAWALPNAPIESADATESLRVSPDGLLAACVAGEGRVVLLSRGRRQVEKIAAVPGLASHVAFSPDGKWLAVGGTSGHIALIDLSQRRVVARLGPLATYVARLCFEAESKRLFVPQRDGTIRIVGLFWLPDSPDPRLIEVTALRAGPYWIESTYVSSDGTRFMAATAWPANRYFMWDTRSESRALRFQPPAIDSQNMKQGPE